jgi:protein-disulfide isomerase
MASAKGPKKGSKYSDRSAQAAALMAEQKRLESRRRFIAIGGVVAVLAVIVGLTVWSITRDDTGDVAKEVPSGVTGDFGVVVGDADASPEIVIYEDFQCPICRDLESVIGEPLQTAIDGGNAQVEFRVVSFLDPQSENEFSSRAANAAAAVHDAAGPDAFKQFHDLVFANQPEEGTEGPSDEQLIEWAVEAGASEADVRGPIEAKAFGQWVVNATDAMSKNDVTGTPTVFIDGERIEGSIQDIADAVLASIG